MHLTRQACTVSGTSGPAPRGSDGEGTPRGRQCVAFAALKSMKARTGARGQTPGQHVSGRGFPASAACQAGSGSGAFASRSNPEVGIRKPAVSRKEPMHSSVI